MKRSTAPRGSYLTPAEEDKALKDRWKTPAGQEQSVAIVRRLLAGQPVRELGLGMYDGRIDLRGFPVPRSALIDQGGGGTPPKSLRIEFHGARLENLDLAGADLEGLRFFNSVVVNCSFSRSICRSLGLWAVEVSDTSFASADLRRAVLGAWYRERPADPGGWSTYRNVTFAGADLRGAISQEASFTDCDFSRAQLVKMDFQASSFVRCRFAGELREVIFHRQGAFTHKRDPNPMEDVDFSDAQLKDVEFRGLNLDRVRFPSGEEHLVVHHYRCVLERALRTLRSADHPAAPGVKALLEVRRKWAGDKQNVGIFNFAGSDWKPQEADFVTSLLREAEAECARGR